MPRPRTHDDTLRARLLAEATRVVSERGAVALTVRDVAARAGTSASAVYALFGSREELLRAASRATQAAFTDRLAQVPVTGDAMADLLALGTAYRDHALASPHGYRVVVEAPLPSGARPEPTTTAAFSLLRAAVARVLPAVPDDAAARLALDLWSLVHGAVALELAGLLPGDDEERAARYVALLRTAGPALVGAAVGRAPGAG
ncbi:TetR/AcrR family transcriptional regulator [Cellulomonas marina]|uniref:DNA-binding transcriptional regulator, AcrR family n=1 Tax=Cellulomonas marina TaxID=988821 RepID=A0A1I0XZN3_9CELL|nr:TetR/AcrR family transcriptional regulator [Cellulomonas marina]GIG28466.1 TetR family transcriptional regulator [Cellulomonas marina]SFB05830.1 DNA-binding transcriptional regulator, AcrR family [Cellulomonas marina]